MSRDAAVALRRAAPPELPWLLPLGSLDAGAAPTKAARRTTRIVQTQGGQTLVAQRLGARRVASRPAPLPTPGPSPAV